MNSSSPASQPVSFEVALQSLQAIVSDLEGGSITLDQSLARFEEGIGLLRNCYQYLEQAEQRIEQLVTLDENGNCTFAPFDATATAEKASKAGRGGKKPSKSKEKGVEQTSAAPEPTEPDDDLDKFLF